VLFLPNFSCVYLCRIGYISTNSWTWIHAAPLDLLLSCTIPGHGSVRPWNYLKVWPACSSYFALNDGAWYIPRRTAYSSCIHAKSRFIFYCMCFCER